jgi:uncharacterized protein
VSNESPCLTCGACCAYFRVSFYWGEAQSAGGYVPDHLTRKINDTYSCMEGTENAPRRCTSLEGKVGERVSCTIYENRPSPCREFACAAEVEEGNSECDKARAHYGLPPLAPLI